MPRSRAQRPTKPRMPYHLGSAGSKCRKTTNQANRATRALLKSVASSNISTLQQGLANQATYWSGVAWVAETLVQRLSGTQAGAIDLVTVTEKLASSVSVPDAGLLHQASRRGERQSTQQDATFPSTVLNVDIGG